MNMFIPIEGEPKRASRRKEIAKFLEGATDPVLEIVPVQNSTVQ
jgi:hypothetical protein